MLLSQIVTKGPLVPGSGTFTEAAVAGGSASTPVFVYNAELSLPFAEQPKTVYWLKIVALTTNVDTQWGWHNRNYTVKDPLAVVPPDLLPGENQVGTIPDPSGGVGTPIYHFQDDAVRGVGITVGTSTGNSFIEEDPNTAVPVNYEDRIDGPSTVAGTDFPGIGQYSKDLAFTLYTIPEPGSLVLLTMGISALVIRRRRNR
jgi:hypothetical protein